MPSKITSAGDSKFRVINKPYHGGDCWINISKDLKPLFNYNKDDEFEIRIHKEDFIKAVNVISIISFDELWECPSKELKRFYYSDEWFKTSFLQITNKFGNNEIAIYNARYGAYSQGRSYIINNDKILNIRDFLVEGHSLITVEKLAENVLDMRIETSIHDLNTFYVKNQIDEKQYDVNELAEILKKQYNNAPDKEKVLSIHMFGLKYGEHIMAGKNIKISQIIALSGLPESYAVEVNKGVNIYLAIRDNKYGVMFGDNINGHFIDKPRVLQQIFYGAPGTGKSHEIKEKTEGQKVVRTTFHPDSDYSSFVGAYKPTTEEVDAPVVPVVVNSGISLEPKGTFKEKRITYKFVIQAFLKAYLGAWKLYSENPDSPDPQFLVIEEINRGNCAQIFGDLFQLLDRNEKGFSEYPIEADSDLTDAINIAFTNEKSDYKLEKVIDVEGVIKNYISNYGSTLSLDIQEGRVLLLPPNLFIWATMNTSDQSLFPIDSAFKRRWDWKYIKISKGYERGDNGEFKLDGDGKKIPLGWKLLDKNGQDWWEFLKKINAIIYSMTQSADKQLGYFFCKADNKVISVNTFVNKVAFYLWNDVFKDYAEEDSTLSKFKKNEEDKEDSDLTFPDFFDEDGKVKADVAQRFIENVMNWKSDEKNKEVD